MLPDTIVVATGNAGKVVELEKLFAGLSVRLRLQSELSVVPAEETGLTFVENAILKARAAAEQTGLAALADDSGLEVDALNGAPGVHSARYAQSGDSEANKAKLLEALSEVEAGRRQARFHCVLVYLRHAADPVPLIARGVWEGSILQRPRGEGGFGYDPLFLVTSHGVSAAELDASTKNAISHRGLASQQLLTQMARL